MEFNTVSISDGITMGTDGHARLARQPRSDRRLDRARRARQPLRRARRARRLRQDDPGAAHGAGAARHPRPRSSTAARSRPGAFDGRDVTIQDVFEAVGAHAAGTHVRRRAAASSKTRACPGAGACGGQFTANTMATACEFLGIARDGQRRRAGDSTRRRPPSARRAGALVMDAAASAASRPAHDHHARGARERDRRRRRDRRIDQRRAAPAGDRAGSGRRARRSTTSIAISARVPLLADLKPGGRFVATDLHAAGGTRLVAQAAASTPGRCTATR